MIKFFRKIRQKLLVENRFNKYLLYAIGEIVLVVIGILIALQINNWNQYKNNQETLKLYLTEFNEEIKFNIRDIKFELQDIDTQKKIKGNLLKNTKLDTILLDTLEKHIETFYINVGYSSTLMKRFENSQISNYGKYDSIFNNLQEFYGYLWPELEKDIEKHNEAVDKEDEFWRYQQNSYELKYSNGNNSFIKDSIQRKKELIKLIKSPIVRNILKSDFRRKTTFKIKLDEYVKMAEKFQKQIDQFLKD